MARTQPIRRDRLGKPLREHDATVTSLTERFTEYLHAKRHSINETTATKDYLYPFSLFVRWLNLIGLPAVVGSYNVDQLESYADYLRERKALPGRRPFDRMTLSVSSQSAYLRPLDQFGDWLAWEGWVPANPFTQTYDSLLPKIKGTTRVLKSATADDVRALLDATRSDDPLSQRDHALLLTGWETGMRTQDLYGLDLPNLDLRTGLLLIVGSKGDRDREVKLGPLALVAVAAYLGTGRPRQVQIAGRRMAVAGRPAFAGTALFLSDKAGQKNSPDGRLTANGIYQLLSRRWNEAGRKGTFGAHRLRHGLATLLVEANVSLAQVSAWLGHSLETTTMLYAHPTATAIHVRVGPVVEASLRDAGYAGMEVA